MKNLIPILFSLLFLGSSAAQASPQDSLFAVSAGDGWSLLQRVRQGETSASISRRFHVPITVLADANGSGASDRFRPGSLITIPIGPYNFLQQPPQAMSEARPLYYRVSAGERIRAIAHRSGVSRDELMNINRLAGEPAPASVLLVGWVRYDATPVGDEMHAIDPLPLNPRTADKETIAAGSRPALDDTASALKPPSMSQLYKEQTQDGQNVVTERGSAGFFPLAGSSAGAAVYAFHNAATKGSIMIVRNLNNGKAIYVKVLGPLPQTQAFAGCIVGLSNRAKVALGVRERKAFCELSYPGN